jgi:hypothetical protein
MWPPEAFRNHRSRSEKSFVSKAVMQASHDFYALVGPNNEFVCSLAIFAPEFSTVNEEFCAVTHERRVFRIGEV